MRKQQARTLPLSAIFPIPLRANPVTAYPESHGQDGFVKYISTTIYCTNYFDQWRVLGYSDDQKQTKGLEPWSWSLIVRNFNEKISPQGRVIGGNQSFAGCGTELTSIERLEIIAGDLL
jgi:hypothetical protein